MISIGTLKVAIAFFLPAILVVGLAPAQAESGTASFDKLLAGGKRAYSKGDYADSEKQLKAALQLIPAGGSDVLHRVETLTELSRTYRKENRLDESESASKEALATMEKVSNTKDGAANLASCMNNLASVYFAENKLEEAEGLAVKALALDEHALGAMNKGLCADLNNLADLYKTEGKADQAIRAYKRVVGITEKNSPDSLELASSLETLAGVYRAAKQPVEAEPVDKRALSLLEKISAKNSHPDLLVEAALAGCLSNIGNTYKALNKFEDAEAVYKRALGIYEKNQDAKAVHPVMNSGDLARACRNLARLYKVEGKVTEAEAFYKRAITINEVSSGESDPAELVKDLASYADLLRKANRSEEAEQIDERVEALRHGTR